MIGFGTAGFRWKDGEVNEEYILHLLKNSIEEFLKSKKRLFQKQSVLVAYDHRPKSKMFAYELSKSKWDLFPEVVTTPILCQQCERTKSWGIMLTASHNPIGDYGIKLIAPNGRIIDSKNVDKINSILEKHQNRFSDNIYEKIIGRYALLENKGKNKYVFYAMNGAARGHAEKYFPRDIWNITKAEEIFDECGSYEPKPATLKKIVDNYKKTNKEFIMFAFDGDGDRLLVNVDGRFLSSSEVLALFLYLEPAKAVYTANMSNLLVDICNDKHIPFIETNIGYQHIGKYLVGKKSIICGEESGGFCFYPEIKDRDGFYAALQLMYLDTKYDIRRIIEENDEKHGRRYYSRLDIPKVLSESDTYELVASLEKHFGKADLNSEEFGLRFECDKGWIMFRRSGTEALTRIYFELYEDKTRFVESAILKYITGKN